VKIETDFTFNRIGKVAREPDTFGTAQADRRRAIIGARGVQDRQVEIYGLGSGTEARGR